MGDRRHVIVHTEGSPDLYMYTHNYGYELPVIVASALDRGRGRWGDGPYLTRIIFSELIKDAVLSETGYGLSTYPTESEYEDVEVWPEGNKVAIGPMDADFETFIKAYLKKEPA